MTKDGSVEPTNDSDVETPVGFKQIGTLRPRTDRGKLPAMRFYGGDHGGNLAHHDVAPVENPDLPLRPTDWRVFGGPQAMNHVAIAMPNRESWQKKLADLEGVDGLNRLHVAEALPYRGQMPGRG